MKQAIQTKIKAFLTRALSCISLFSATLFAGQAAHGAAPASAWGTSEALEAGFRTPPPDSGIRAFWWWLNSNVTKEAITRDLEEMKDKGYSGALIFDAGGSSHVGNQQVPAGPVFAGPEWTELFVHACEEAARLDLELSLNIQSGWNLGGPKVTPEEASQHLIWSQTQIEGGQQIERTLPLPKGLRDGYFRDVAVLAFPLPVSEDEVNWTLSASSTQSSQYPVEHAADGRADTFWVSGNAPSREDPPWLMLEFSRPAPIDSFFLKGRSGYGPREYELQLSEDGSEFETVAQGNLKKGQTLEAAFDERQARALRLRFMGSHDPGERNVQVAEMTVPGVIAKQSFRPIEKLQLKSMFRELGASAPDTRYLLNVSDPLAAEPSIPLDSIRNLSAYMDADGTLSWDAPEGTWVLLRFAHSPTGAHVSTHSTGWGGRVLDYLNPDALRHYWNRNIEPLMEAIGPLAGTALGYVHTDSWEGGGMNWTPGFDIGFIENMGYDPLPWLAVLAGYVVDDREASNSFLADFRKTIGDRVAAHYALLGELAEAHGMGTHPESAGPHAGPIDGLKNYGRSDLAMSEFWAPSPHRPRLQDRFFVKQAASAAHTYGLNLIGAEGFTTIGTHWNVVPWSDMKSSFDYEVADGLNLLFHHTFTCSPEEMGLPGQEYFAGTHFNPQITWWEETPAFIDYMRRIQYLVQKGRFVADVLYYYGDHVPNIGMRKDADPAGALPGFDYDLLSEELLLDDLRVENRLLKLSSGMEYRILVLPDHRVLSPAAMDKVDQLVRAGATILGPKPLRPVSLVGGAAGKVRFHALADQLWGGSDTSAGEKIRQVGQGRVVRGMSAREFLLADGVPEDLAFVESTGDSARWIHYRLGEGDLYFIHNFAKEPLRTTARFRLDGKVPEFWNPVDGSIREARSFSSQKGRTAVPLEFDPYGSVFVYFRKPAADERRNGPNFPAWQALDPIAGPWDVQFDPKWGGPSKPVRFEALQSWTESQIPGVRYYSGKARYETHFQFNRAQTDPERPLYLELGAVGDLGIARVILNGQDLGVAWRPPFRIRIDGAVRSGANRLEIEVVNSWRNRLFRDDQLPASERLTQTNIKVQNWRGVNWVLEPSGLFGPVRLSQPEF